MQLRDKTELNDACELACMEIQDSENELFIRTKFNLLDKSNIGILIFLGIGIIIFGLTVTKADDLLEKIVGLTFSLLTIGFSSATLLKQITDFIRINTNELEFRNSLKKGKYKLSSDLKIKMLTKKRHVKLKTQPGSGSDFRVIELNIVTNGTENRILDFQMDEKHNSIANKLGSDISALIKERITACNNGEHP